MHIYVNQIERLKKHKYPAKYIAKCTYMYMYIYKRGKLVTITLKGSHTLTCSMPFIVFTRYVLFSQSENKIKRGFQYMLNRR